MNFIKKPAIMASILAMLISSTVQASVTVGKFGGGNCYPYSCFAGVGGTEYQEIFSSKAFSGSIAINSISVSLHQAGLMDSATYRLSLSTTSKAVNGLDYSNTDNNIGVDNSLFGTFTLGGNMPNVLTFNGTTFNYNPTVGNLLLDVKVLGVTHSVGYSSFFNSDYTGDTNALNVTGGGINHMGAGLVTTFGSATAVPEPETYTMLLAGLGLMGFMIRRRKTS